MLADMASVHAVPLRTYDCTMGVRIAESAPTIKTNEQASPDKVGMSFTDDSEVSAWAFRRAVALAQR